MDLLHEAVRRGKEVTVVVELKARFDEETNINWAEMLESIGTQVLYGVVGLKTHAKMMIITRREGTQLKRYAHLSTGSAPGFRVTPLSNALRLCSGARS